MPLNNKPTNNYKQAKLINPTKSESGLVAKDVIQKIVTKISSNSEYNLWKNSLDTKNWFHDIENGKKSTTYNLI